MTFKTGNLVFIKDRNAVDVMGDSRYWLDVENATRTIYGYQPDEGAVGVVVQDYDPNTGFVGVRMNYSLVVIVVGAHGLSLISESAPPQPSYQVGDFITVEDTDELYTTYQSWLTNPDHRALYAQFNHPPHGVRVGEVVQVSSHSDIDGNTLLGVRIAGKIYIIGAPGVKLVVGSIPAPKENAEVTDLQILHAALSIVLDDRCTSLTALLEMIYEADVNPSLTDITKMIQQAREGMAGK